MTAILKSPLAVRALAAWRGPLAQPPLPLLDPDHRLMVVWAAKAACTTTFVWFASRIGVLGELQRSQKSPHAYRTQDYYGSDLHRRGKTVPVKSYLLLHVLRDPYSRAVSSYRQALRTGYTDKRLTLPPIGPVSSRTGFSFSRYLDYLDTIDLQHSNIHHRLQVHAVEARRAPDHVINISTQDLLAELNRLENLYGWPRTDFTAMPWLHEREARRRARTRTFASGGVEALPLDREAARGESWPDYEAFLSAPVRRRIERLYARDFEAFAAHL